MKNFKKTLSVLVLLLLVMAVFVGCENGTTDVDDTDDTDDTTTVTVVQPYEVGDEIAGGYEVTIADELGGFVAKRAFDENDDGDMLDADDEYQKLVSGRFGTDMTWGDETEDYVYYLIDAVFIGNDNANNCTLTIEEGTLIKGEVSTTQPGVLVITRGSKIQAVGTAADPIVFTSARAAGTRAPGDWGGLVINGNAPVSEGDNVEGEGSTGQYGGTISDDDSGTIQYVRVEFAGTLFSADNELNGIAFQGVGSGTTVDHIQVHMNADDGVEFFGGTVSANYVVVTGAGDDSLDWTWGWNGTVQYGILQQYSGRGDHGFEGDGHKTAGTTPISEPTFKNFTVIGSDRDDGALFRRETNATLVNTIFTGFATDGSMDETDELDGGTISYLGVLATNDAQADATDWDAAVTATTAAFTGDTHNLPAAALAGANEASVDVQPTAEITNGTVSLDASGAAFFGAIAHDDASPWYAGWTDTPAN